ncbi:permease for cytosine/purines, uracil, thiamine, allantoin-domain-containing protein [Aspergillus ambiguus]|uniref:permease for cytosine/purines, uracil, thiamine, allantoin-domain-containing protein n=1 Tax=Aspergillus ambiguus TaxID=176160 RepID=UPI003CCD0FC6
MSTFKQSILDWLEVPEAPENHQAVGNSRWSNKDLEPTYPEERTWTWYNLPLYWFSVAFGATGWNVAASLVAVGLEWLGQVLHTILGCDPVLSRSVLGMYGSFFFIFLRAVVCIIWYGIQSFYGANLLSIMLRCMFGYKWNNFANTLPASANVTSQQLLCFFLVWLMELPFCFVHPTKIHWLFSAKGVVMPFITFGLFGWCMAQGAGISSIDLASKGTASSTPSLGWAIMDGINVIMGSLSPMLVNQPDLARYCKKPRDAGWVQGAAVFVSKVVVFFLGLASTASIQGAWGTAYWNIWDLLGAILDHYWTPAARFAVWLVAFAFLFSQFGTNFGANSIPFGADMTGLFPRLLTIRRGQVLCAILGVAVVPWQLIANAGAFLSFLSSYNIFMAPLSGIIIVDYVLARKGNIHVPSLYIGSKKGLYWFWSGANWLGVFAWCGGVAMGLPGLVGKYQPELVSAAAINMFKMGWILTFVTASVVYFVLIKAVPPQVFPEGLEGLPVRWEYLAKEGREGFLDGERGDGQVVEAEKDLDMSPEKKRRV